MTTERKFALLIDAENVSAKYVKTILDEVSNYGDITYRRIYGDWTSSLNSNWKQVLLDHSITPIQQYSYTTGKNASDSAMIIDAMDILYTGRVDGFCIVSSDSDFTRLAARLRESGMNVIGMGESKTPHSFICACNNFKYLDILYREAESEEMTSESLAPHHPQPQTKLSTIRRTIRTILQENSDEDGRLPLSNVGNRIAKRFPDFDVRNYGHKKLTTLVSTFPEFVIEAITSNPNSKVKLVYISLDDNYHNN